MSNKSRPQKKTQGKNVSLKQIADKVVDVLSMPFQSKSKQKKPFGGKGGRKKKLTGKELKIQEAKNKVKELEAEAKNLEEQSSTPSLTSVFGSFFYTDESFITQFEDQEIIQYINQQCSDANLGTIDESHTKKTIISILNNNDLMCQILERYNMNIFEFFKFLYRVDSSVFKSSFIQKIQKTILNKPYAVVKQHKYRFTSN